MSEVQEFLNISLLHVGETDIRVRSVLIAAILTVLMFWLARFAERMTKRVLRRNGVKDEGSIGATARLVFYFFLVIGITTVVHSMGLDLGALFAAGAFFAVAIGFAMQNITQNFVSGLILLMERTIKPGDILEVQGRMVRVTSLGLRSTVVRTWDADDYIIPNSTLVSETVKNFTLRDRLHRLRVPVGVTYDSDMRVVRSVLLAASESVTFRDTSMKPVVLMKGFGSSSVDFEASIWVHDPFNRAMNLSEFTEIIWFALKDANLTIAFPQLDVHLDPPKAAEAETVT